MSGRRIAVVLFGPQGQGSFNESGAQGAERARQRWAGHQVETVWIEPREPDQRAERLQALCEQGWDLVVAHGGQGDEPVSRVAPRFNQTAFAITQGGWVSSNCANYEVLQEQSAFLAGVLAAHYSRSGVVAHLSGERVRPGLKGRAAFADGVEASGKHCRFVTGFCGHQHDPERAYQLMQRIRSEGADVVFAMIDGGRPGVIRACREAGIVQIGNVLDWVARDPDVFIASAIADSGACAEAAIADFLQGRWRGGQHQSFGVESAQSVRLLMRADIARDFGAIIDDWVARLSTGSQVPAIDYAGSELM
jgi:basic membrane protein A